VHGAVCSGGRGEVCGDAVRGAGVGQAQPAVAIGEGDLFGQRAIHTGQAQESKHSVHRLALCSLNSVTHMLAWTALRQVCHSPLKAAMEQKPAVLGG
jgi:hypothetical protein